MSKEIAGDISAALAAGGGARRCFETLPPSHRREYLTWIEQAKRPLTRARRIASMVERLAVREGIR